jgi:hypothetical protein
VVPNVAAAGAEVEIGLPHMSAAELALFRQAIKGRASYCEFGVGGSTLLAVEAGIGRIVSVESDKAWLDAAGTHPVLRSAVAEQRLTLLHADIGQTKEWGFPADATAKPRWPGYWMRPWALWAEQRAMPELVFVDGRFRVACCLAALQFALAAGAPPEAYAVVIHDFDATRPHYDAVTEFFDVIEQTGSLKVMRARAQQSNAALASELAEFGMDPR